jgi:hypothetical protein
MAAAAGIGTKMWSHSAEMGATSTPCDAAALVTASAFAFGTDHISAFVRFKFWTTTSPARFLIASYAGEPDGGSFVMMSGVRSSLAWDATAPTPSHSR